MVLEELLSDTSKLLQLGNRYSLTLNKFTKGQTQINFSQILFQSFNNLIQIKIPILKTICDLLYKYIWETKNNCDTFLSLCFHNLCAHMFHYVIIFLRYESYFQDIDSILIIIILFDSILKNTPIIIF